MRIVRFLSTDGLMNELLISNSILFHDEVECIEKSCSCLRAISLELLLKLEQSRFSRKNRADEWRGIFELRVLY